jgi:hypothetical protein
MKNIGKFAEQILSRKPTEEEKRIQQEKHKLMEEKHSWLGNELRRLKDEFRKKFGEEADVESLIHHLLYKKHTGYPW